METAAYFLRIPSFLFRSEMFDIGNKLSLDDFFENITSFTHKFRNIFHDQAGIFNSVKEIVSVVKAGRCDLHREISLLLDCLALEITNEEVKMFHIVAILTEILMPLSHFVSFCKQLKFNFTKIDRSFHEIENISVSLSEEKVNDWTVDEILQISSKICNKLLATPNNEISKYPNSRDMKSVLDLLCVISDISRHVEVWIFIREMKWFGKDGLKQFYKEYNNVTNVLLSGDKSSFEMSVLDCLESIARYYSEIGNLTNADTLNEFLTSIKDLKLVKDTKIRLKFSTDLHSVQESISSIRDWFTTGLDEMAVIFSKFSNVWNSGNFVNEEGYLGISYINYSGSPSSLKGVDLVEFVQQLGFIQHENGEASINVKYFLDQYQVLKHAMSVFSLISHL